MIWRTGGDHDGQQQQGHRLLVLVRAPQLCQRHHAHRGRVPQGACISHPGEFPSIAYPSCVPMPPTALGLLATAACMWGPPTNHRRVCCMRSLHRPVGSNCPCRSVQAYMHKRATTLAQMRMALYRCAAHSATCDPDIGTAVPAGRNMQPSQNSWLCLSVTWVCAP